MRCGWEYNLDCLGVGKKVEGENGGKKSLQEFTDTDSVNYGRYDNMGIKNLNKLLSEEAPEVKYYAKAMMGRQSNEC